MVHLFGFPRASRHSGGQRVPLTGERRRLCPWREIPREGNTGQDSKEAGRELYKSYKSNGVQSLLRVSTSRVRCSCDIVVGALLAGRQSLAEHGVTGSPASWVRHIIARLCCVSRAPDDSVRCQERILTYSFL